MVKNTTEAKVRRILEKNDPVTRIAGQSDTKLSEQSYFEVYELVLDKDEDEVKLLISGNEVFVALQASLLPAIQQLIRHELARSDLGTFVGYPYAEYVQQHVAPVSVQIHWRLNASKPYEPNSEVKRLNGRTPPRPFLTIPNIHQKTSEKPLALDMGRKAVAVSTAFNIFSVLVVLQSYFRNFQSRRLC